MTSSPNSTTNTVSDKSLTEEFKKLLESPMNYDWNATTIDVNTKCVLLKRFLEEAAPNGKNSFYENFRKPVINKFKARVFNNAPAKKETIRVFFKDNTEVLSILDS